MDLFWDFIFRRKVSILFFLILGSRVVRVLVISSNIRMIIKEKRSIRIFIIFLGSL